MLNRRSFLLRGAGAGAGYLLAQQLALAAAIPLPSPAPGASPAEDENYWASLRKLFPIPADEIYLNNGTCGSNPQPVLKAVFDGFQQTERMDQSDPEDYPIWGYGPWNEYRDPVAAFVGASRDEIALVRNATEANSYIANGIDMKAGDEVLMSDQEHPSGEQPWQLRAKRYGVVVKKFTLPKPVPNADTVLNLINDAITSRTRVIFVSHIATVTGTVLPVKQIAALARSKNIISAFDGAHVPGMIQLNLRDIGCDLYSASPHKWLQAPKGTGFLYLRPDIVDRIWNTVVTAGWDDMTLKAERFMRIGSSNVPILMGLRAAIQFASQIGMDRMEQRQRQLADYIHAGMIKRGAQSWTSPDPVLRAAIAAVDMAPIPMRELEQWMWKTHKIRVRGTGPNTIRLSTPYYLTHADIDRFLDKYDDFRKMKGIA